MVQKHIEITEEGLKNIKEELDYLKNVKRPENLEALKEARAQGDLSENADYDAAREEQAQIERRIKEIENIIKHAKVIKPNTDDVVNIGKKIDLRFENGVEKTIYLVGREESNPLLSKISVESPLGRAIRDHKENDVVTYKSETNKSYNVTILKVTNSDK